MKSGIYEILVGGAVYYEVYYDGDFYAMLSTKDQARLLFDELQSKYRDSI